MDKAEWNNLPKLERFAALWPPLVDLLKEMGVPFVLAIQFSQEDKEKPHAYHLIPGMDPRIVFAAILAREGTDGLAKLIPGLGKLEQMDMSKADGQRHLAELEAGDMHMEQLKMPIFVDTMREIEENGEGEDVNAGDSENPL